jgi:tetratricopeptide (TPR) repeat protein
MDLIESIRQMMAEENFSSAEQALEVALISAPPTSRPELISLYLETLIHQKKSLPDHLVSEVVHLLWEKNPEFALNIFDHSSESLKSSNDSRVLFFRMKLSEKRGHIQELHDLISDYHLHLFERSLPFVPPFVNELVQKYFRVDFQLTLQGLALTLLRKDLKSAETQIQNLILEAHEKSSPKILREKLTALHHVLVPQTEKGLLEIYQSFLSILVHGFQDKKDYKRLAEAVIYFEDFRFNVMLMQILEVNGHTELASGYAHELADHKKYDFVYIAKHFPDLKKYFVSMTQPIARATSWETPDLSLDEEIAGELVLSDLPERFEDEAILVHLVKNQEFSEQSLLDLSVSFIQSELPRVALAAAMLVHERTTDNKIKLKAAYLALTSLLQSGDYRKAVDLALESMKLVDTTADLLSFLYCEAEAYLRLEMKPEARQVLKKILSIDSRYRMARERLERLE